MPSRRRRAIWPLFAAALISPLILATPDGAGATPATGGWTDIPHAHPAGQQSYLVDDWSDGTDIWAAGYRRILVGGVVEWRTWVQRCSGSAGTCALENTLDIEGAPSVTYLQGVTGTSSTDVWVAGYAKVPFEGWNEPLIEHFDGSSWSIVETPVDVGDLYGISAVSADDVWAVGDDKRETFKTKPLILHWDGTNWSEQRIQVPGCRSMQVWDVDATGRHPLAVGTCWDRHSHGHPTILSLGVEGWRADTIEGLSRKREIDLTSVAWTGQAAWASASFRNLKGVVLRLEDHTWTVAETPPHAGAIAGFAGPNAHDVWAVGTAGFSWSTMHWNGSVWTQVADPGNGWLESVTMTADGVPWSVGETSMPSVSEIQRYDGPIP